MINVGNFMVLYQISKHKIQTSLFFPGGRVSFVLSKSGEITDLIVAAWYWNISTKLSAQSFHFYCKCWQPVSCILIFDFTQKCHGHNANPGRMLSRPGHTAKPKLLRRKKIQHRHKQFVRVGSQCPALYSLISLKSAIGKMSFLVKS